MKKLCNPGIPISKTTPFLLIICQITESSVFMIRSWYFFVRKLHLNLIFFILTRNTINIDMKVQNKTKLLQNKPQDPEPPEHLKDFDTSLPLPKGNSPYALAKRAEYIHKDLELAKFYYYKAIKQGDRVESAIKDIASILHQLGQTSSACEFLSEHQKHFKDHKRFENLLSSLQKQIVPSENCLKRILKLFPVSEMDKNEDVMSFFKNSSRILEIDFHYHNNTRCAFIKFQSHSSARKTLEGLLNWENHRVEWVSAQELEDIKNLEFWTFALDTQQPALSRGTSTDEDTAKKLIGMDLLRALNEDNQSSF